MRLSHLFESQILTMIVCHFFIATFTCVVLCVYVSNKFDFCRCVQSNSKQKANYARREYANNFMAFLYKAINRKRTCIRRHSLFWLFFMVNVVHQNNCASVGSSFHHAKRCQHKKLANLCAYTNNTVWLCETVDDWRVWAASYTLHNSIIIIIIIYPVEWIGWYISLAKSPTYRACYIFAII